MPWRPRPPCRYPGCPNLQTQAIDGFCEAHRAEAERRQHRGRYRTSARQRGYDRLYERNRALLLARRPLCESCRAEGRVTVAIQAHHRVPLSQGGSNDVANLVALCGACHERLHADEQWRARVRHWEKERFFWLPRPGTGGRRLV